MNLNCSLNGIAIDLRQTPTYISNMCMIQPSGKVAMLVTGKKAKHALYIYTMWVKNSTNGVWNNDDDLNCAREDVQLELDKIKKIISSRKKLEVWIS
jgi:hypothetical protein